MYKENTYIKTRKGCSFLYWYLLVYYYWSVTTILCAIKYVILWWRHHTHTSPPVHLLTFLAKLIASYQHLPCLIPLLELQYNSAAPAYLPAARYILLRCSHAHVFRCSCVQIFLCWGLRCSYVQVHRCSNNQVFRFAGVQVLRCWGIQMFKCSGTHVYSFTWHLSPGILARNGAKK